MASNNVVESVVEIEEYGIYGIVCVEDETIGRLMYIERMVKHHNRNNRVVIDGQTGEIKIVRSSHNASHGKVMAKHNAVMISTHDSKWVALDEGNGRPLMMAAERCSRIYPHDLF